VRPCASPRSQSCPPPTCFHLQHTQGGTRYYQDACSHPHVPACLACNTPRWPLRGPVRVELGGEGVGAVRARGVNPPRSAACVRARQRRCKLIPPGAAAPHVGLGRSPQACMGVDRGRLAPPTLCSTRHLHACPQQSFWPSHARARMAEGVGGAHYRGRISGQITSLAATLPLGSRLWA